MNLDLKINNFIRLFFNIYTDLIYKKVKTPIISINIKGYYLKET